MTDGEKETEDTEAKHKEETEVKQEVTRQEEEKVVALAQTKKLISSIQKREKEK